MPSPVETLIIQAWKNAFVPSSSSIPAVLQATENSTIPDTSSPDPTGNINLCYVPVDPPAVPPMPKGNANVACTGMHVTGQGGAQWMGDPTFDADDTACVLPLKIPTLQVQGTCNITQECCTPALFWCVGDNQSQDSEGFHLTASDVAVNLHCSISPDASVIVNALELQFGSTSVSIDNNTPSWLQWLEKLFTLDQSGNIGSSIQASTQALLGNQQMLAQFQTAINSLLGKAKTATVTRASLQALALAHGLPPAARPYGYVAIAAEPSGETTYTQHFAGPVPGGSRGAWRARVRVAAGIDGGSASRVEVEPLASLSGSVPMLHIVWSGTATNRLNQAVQDPGQRVSVRNAIEGWIRNSANNWHSGEDYNHIQMVLGMEFGYLVAYQETPAGRTATLVNLIREP